MVDQKKIILGQFFTKESVWLKDHIKKFIINSKTTVAYDPFAGAGDLLNIARELGYKEIVGLDIDRNLSWQKNDSLLSIPHIDNAIIITNPPYISNYSASRKKVNDKLKKYFDFSKYNDLYLIALDKILKAQEYAVAIIPETFINSNFLQKNRLYSLTVLEENPFNDTDTPVIVACFDGRIKDLSEVAVYKNCSYVNSLGAIEKMRLTPNKKIKISFNNENGWLGVRCVDSTNPNEMLKFDFKENINYNWDKGIKISSRLFTLIDIDIQKDKRSLFIDECNNILQNTREKTNDIIFSPFKGNTKNSRRRRRLDFLTCRAIMERAYINTVDNLLKGITNEN